jgi:hypothetical protein
LFTDSYALAAVSLGTTPTPFSIQQNKTLDLAYNNELIINMSDLFESSTISSNILTGSIVVRETSNLSTTVSTYPAFSSAYLSCGTLYLYGNHLGSYTVTIQATNKGTEDPYDVVEASFTVGIIDIY